MDRNASFVVGIAAPAVLGLMALASVASADRHEAGDEGGVEMARAAQAELRPIGAGEVSGTFTFQELEEAVRVSGVVRGLSPGKHGLHVHEGRSCEERGGHFAPQGSPHGSPDAQQRHVGDLGNLVASAEGEAAYLRVDRRIALSGPDSIVGRVLVVHQGEDDYRSQPSGDAGRQIACGRIELETAGPPSKGGPAPTPEAGGGASPG